MSLILDGTNGLSDVDGTAAAPAIRGTDANTGVFFPAADTIAFSEGGVESVRINASGNVGIGVVPSIYNLGKALEVGALGCGLWTPAVRNIVMNSNAYYDSGNKYATTGLASSYQQANGVHYWYNAASGTAGNAITFTQAMTLDSSGNLGIGITSPTRKLAVSGTWTNTGDYLMDSDSPQLAWTSGDLRFKYAGLSGTEAMRINSSGNLLVGATTGIGSSRFLVSCATSDYSARFVSSSATDPYGPIIDYTGAAPNDTQKWFLTCRDTSATRFQVRSNGGLANYSANNVNLSDRREKINFAPAKSYLDVICAIPVQTFNYIDQNLEEDAGLTLGVVAQDVQAVAPEMVMESNWGTQEDPKMRLSIYQTDLQYALMKCIQEQQALITQQAAALTALTTRSTALEERLSALEAA